MKSLLGCHWIREHPDNNRDFAHIERMQYPSIKLFKPAWDNRDFCRDLLSVLPKDAYILARDHALSEQKEGMWSDPVGHGTYHANEWAMKVASGQVHTPDDRTFFLGINEPDATSGDRNAIDLYTAAFLNRLQTHGLRGGAFNFSTGHPRTVDGTGGSKADYSVFERAHGAIVRGHHIGVLHIYGTAATPCAPGHFDRLKACPWQDVEWVVGEFGVDEHVIGGGEHAGFHKYFNGRLDDYCGWLDTLIIGVNDARIHSYQVFTYDFSHPWGSFDVREIRDALESYQWLHMKQRPPKPDAQPVDTHLPSVGTGPKPTPAYVSATAGANFRKAPRVDGDIITAIPYGDQVSVYPDETGTNWHLVEYRGNSGYIRADLLSAEPVTPTPSEPEPPIGDNWSRAWPIVLKIEGGLSLDPNDTGNYYQGKLIGTKFGISAAVWGGQYDIPNLTKEQALDIYKRAYWDAAGCNALAWPMCLIHFDTAIQHGVGVAQKLLNHKPTPEEIYLGLRALRYFEDPKWKIYGVAWGNRIEHLNDIVDGETPA